MKNLKQLCLFLSAGGIAALSIGACSDDPATTTGTAGMASTAGTTTTAGTTGTAGTTTTAGTTGTAGTGTAGTATGGGGAGGAGGGSGGKAGAGGTGGASGGSGGASGGSGGSGGAPSADCTKWCSGAMGVVTFCTGSGLAPNVDSEAKCIAHCTAPEAAGDMGLKCWNEHLANAIKAMPDLATAKTMHCPHASGAQGQNVCNKTM